MTKGADERLRVVQVSCNLSAVRLVKGMQEGAMCNNRLSVGVFGLAILLLSTMGTAQPARAQYEPPAPPQMQGGRERMAGGERAGGTIVSVGVDRIEVKRMNGESQTVMVNDQTRILEGQRDDQKTLGLEDLKAGDHVMVMGKSNDNKEFLAAVVRRLTPEEVARMQNAGDRAFGQIVSIEGNEIKVHNQFRGDQVVVVSDQTSIMKDGQAITLKDLKVGDRIIAMGKETDGKLTAERVTSGRFQRGRGRMNRTPSSVQPPPQNP
jgi:Domain of unknown function (DUF5666)